LLGFVIYRSLKRSSNLPSNPTRVRLSAVESQTDIGLSFWGEKPTDIGLSFGSQISTDIGSLSGPVLWHRTRAPLPAKPWPVFGSPFAKPVGKGGAERQKWVKDRLEHTELRARQGERI
jgi:hypothetical protein